MEQCTIIRFRCSQMTLRLDQFARGKFLRVPGKRERAGFQDIRGAEVPPPMMMKRPHVAARQARYFSKTASSVRTSPAELVPCTDQPRPRGRADIGQSAT